MNWLCAACLSLTKLINCQSTRQQQQKEKERHNNNNTSDDERVYCCCSNHTHTHTHNSLFCLCLFVFAVHWQKSPHKHTAHSRLSVASEWQKRAAQTHTETISAKQRETSQDCSRWLRRHMNDTHTTLWFYWLNENCSFSRKLNRIKSNQVKAPLFLSVLLPLKCERTEFICCCCWCCRCCCYCSTRSETLFLSLFLLFFIFIFSSSTTHATSSWFD